MKIIGHRGAAGHELENSLASLHHGASLPVWAIEFDVRRTKDNQLVVFHDPDLKRVASKSARICDMTLKQLEKVPLLTGSHIPTLKEALEVIGNKRAVIELKDTDTAELLLEVLAQFPEANVIIASFKLGELNTLRGHRPDLTLYALERTRPFDSIQLAKKYDFNGIGMNYWLLNPLTYFLCRRAKLAMYVYTIDVPFLARFVTRLYPGVVICTNYPERFLRKSAV